MAYIIETPNPFEPLTDVKKYQHPGGITIWEWLQETYPGFIEFPVPTVCVVNGEAILRKDWNRIILSGDIINFISFPGYFAIIVILVVAVVAMTIVTALNTNSNAAVTPGETPASAPVFSTAGQNNTVRLGEPIETCYGRNRIYPSLAARPAFNYIDNDQFQQALYCLGQGEYDIEAIQIGDTPISSYAEVEYEVITPGSTVSLFPTNVITSVEAGGHTLFSPNQPEYVDPGWAGPFPTNPPTTLASTIAVDLVYPKGVYYLDTNGQMVDVGVTVEIEYRLIDDLGAPLGGYTPLFDPAPDVFTAHTTTPQRRTLSSPVAPGRYEVRMRRTDLSIVSYRAGSDVIWEGMRAWIDAPQDWGNLTLLAVRIRATNNLNYQTETKFNVIATRKLPLRVDGEWTAPTATRSIVWAFVDLMRSHYGGRIDEDVFFDWETLEALDALYTERGEYFDWIFRDAITVWEAAQAIGVVGRATPLLIGSLITLRRDGPLEVPVAMFTPDNILSGTFQWDVKLWDLDEFDSVTVEYTEPATGYLQETVTCTLPGGTTDHPDEIRLSGCQDRTHAYRAGLYMMANKRYLRENITFDTGMEGLLPGYGDLIAIAHDVPRSGQSGYVVQAVVQGDGETWQLFLSEPVRWEASGDYQILLRGNRAQVIGPFTAVATTADNQVQIVIPVSDTGDTGGDFDFLTGGETEPMLFLFGQAGRVTKLAKVVRIEPKGNEAVTITAVNDAPLIHSYDDLMPPPLNQLSYPPVVPDLPIIEHLYLSQIGFGGEVMQAAWSAALGAQRYVIHTSVDNIHWQERAVTTRTSVQLQADPGPLYVRVAGINQGQGPWIADSISIRILMEITEPWEGETDFTVGWSGNLFADAYLIKIYDATPTAPVLKRTVTQPERTYNYTWAMATADGNVVRDILVVVDALYDGVAAGVPGQQELENHQPAPPFDLGYEETSPGLYRLFWTLPPGEGDLLEIRVWLESTSGWDPEVTGSVQTLVATDLDAVVTVPLDSDGTHPDYYFRVGLFDVWGNERTGNVSPETVLSQPT